MKKEYLKVLIKITGRKCKPIINSVITHIIHLITQQDSVYKKRLFKNHIFSEKEKVVECTLQVQSCIIVYTTHISE